MDSTDPVQHTGAGQPAEQPPNAERPPTSPSDSGAPTDPTSQVEVKPDAPFGGTKNASELPSEQKPPGASLPTSSIDLLIQRLTDRAERLACWNVGILIMTGVIIAVCFGLFWRSDAIVEHLGQLESFQKANAQEREKLGKQRDKLNEQFGDADFKLVAIDTKEKSTKVVENYLNVIRQFTEDFKSTARYNDPSVITKCKARIRLLIDEQEQLRQARAILQAVADAPAGGIVVEYQNEKVTLPEQILKSMSGELFANGVKAASVAQDLDKIAGLLRTILVALEQPNEQEVQRQLAALETLVAADYAGVKKAYDVYVEEKRTQGNVSQALRLTNIREQLKAVDAQIAELEKKDAELQRSAYQSVNSYGAWVPSLAVRVCCVILALFMTQFFMAIYRYNTMVASHYHSRADLLRMVCKQGQPVPVDADVFAKLAPHMTIEKIEFNVPASVIDQLIAAAARAKTGGREGA